MIRLLPLLAALGSTTAFAQDGEEPPADSDTDSEAETPAPADPWAPPGTESDAPTATPPAAALPVDTAPEVPTPDTEVPVGDGEVTDDGAELPQGEATADEATAAEPTKAERLPADPAELAGANVPTGVRIQPYGAGTGVDVGQAFVMGRNGGTNQTTFRARFASGKWGAQLALPFVVHRMPRQPRDTGLGNLQLDLWRQIGDGSKGYTAIGAEFHTNIGAKAYTWVHDADDVWPSTGLDLALQFRRGNDKLSTMWRFAFGVRGGQDYAPWANTYVTIEAAAGLDYKLGDRFGLVGETSLAYWDLSPWDASALLRADLSPGLRLRGGLVFPVGVWTGMSRVDEDFRGLRETTAVLDLSLSL